MKLTAIAAMLLLVAGNATADDEFTKWRVGGGLAYSDYQAEFSGVNINDGGSGFKAYAQYRLKPWIGIEGAYYDSPEFWGDTTPHQQGGEVETSYDGLTLHLIGYLPSFSERMDFFLKGGYFKFDTELTQFETAGNTTNTGSTDGFAIGIGSAIDAGDNIGIRAEFDWYDTSGEVDLWTITIGAEYRF